MTCAEIVVKVLGSGTCVPSAARFPSSYFLQTTGSVGGWMMDIGPGALQRLAQAGESYKDLERVFISHIHPDHTASLIPLLQALKYTPDSMRTKLLTVYGPEMVLKYLELHLDFTPTLRPDFPFEFVVLKDGSEISESNWRLVSLEMRHGDQTLGFRLTVEDCTLAYGADSGYCESIVDLAKGADLLILEASFPKSQPSEMHLTTTDAGNIATAAQVPRLMLTHLYPEVAHMPKVQREAEVRESGFTGDVIFAEDLMEVHVRGASCTSEISRNPQLP